ncbi:hypothetical protein [Cognatilysobacter terrigena]|uniref:hypothetical protein n=1 Tax=Cognatilysobacter terrigena TaxID=2488749 RepID=UPI00141525D5|nr:hypothetical protein [Lysobacter terrigena]
MRIVEFVGVIVALIGLFAWLLGRPHTLESVERERSAAARVHDASNDGEPDR